MADTVGPVTYQYVKNDGSLGTVTAMSPDEAIKNAPDRKSDSGVSVAASPIPTEEPKPITKGDASMGPVDEEPIDNDDLNTSSDYLKTALSDYNKLFKEYLSTFQASPEEQKAQQQLDALNANSRLLSAAMEGQGMDLSFVRGQQANIEKRQAIEADYLEQRLNRIQSGRMTKAELLQAQMEGVNHQIEIAERLQKTTNPELLQTYVDDKTGAILGVVQNPNGSIVTKTLGNISPKLTERYAQYHFYTHAGKKILVGVTFDGKTESMIVGDADMEDGSSAIFSLDEVQKLGLPISVLSLDAQTVADQFGSDTPPDWFQVWIQNMEGEGGRQVSYQEAASRWGEFRNQILYDEEDSLY